MICAVCGCTDERACYDQPTGQVCGWADEGLCTFCAAGGPPSEVWSERNEEVEAVVSEGSGAGEWGAAGSEELTKARAKDVLGKARDALDTIEEHIEAGEWRKAAFAYGQVAAALALQGNAANVAARIKAGQN